MAQNYIVQLTDDIDGGEADETISFALSGTSYEIDLKAENADKLREAFAPFIEKARLVERGTTGTRARRSTSTGDRPKTLFSQLDSEEKDRFRKWADMPTARRVSDAKVQAWLDAGRP